MTATADNLVWIDLEMTGLDPARDRIIEIATIVTDSQLRVLAEGPVVAIHQSESVLECMDEWNRRTHQLTTADAERVTLEFLALHAEPGASPMCGNSICQDRRFLAREMPVLEAYFHYRNLDVSTLKELARRWAPDVLAGVSKNSQHLALADIRESIAELEHYRLTLFRAG
jgi:oligoribonuclease